MSFGRLPLRIAIITLPVVVGCSGNSGTPGAGGAAASIGGESSSNPAEGGTTGNSSASEGGAVTSSTASSNGGTVSSTTSSNGGTVSSTTSSNGGTVSSTTSSDPLGGNASSGGSTTGTNSGKGGSVQGGNGSGGAIVNGGSSSKGGSTATGGKAASGGASGAATGGSSSAAGATSCPAPPADAPSGAVTALNTVNAARLGMGVPCDSLVSALITSAQAHCDYYATNKGASGGCDSTASAHAEVSGCPGFTGADVGTRIKAAGYSGRGYSECMAFLNNPTNSVMMFINSVYHRGPVLSPWMRDMGYGAATGCDTIDFGTGTATPNTVVAVYPYAGQTGVPVNFRGSQEGPTPPAPASGWPSGYPITVYAQGATVTVHELLEESTGTPIEHVWITPSTDPNKALSNSVVLYANTALKAATTYRVNIQGTQTLSGTTTDLNLSWTFTTK